MWSLGHALRQCSYTLGMCKSKNVIKSELILVFCPQGTVVTCIF